MKDEGEEKDEGEADLEHRSSIQTLDCKSNVFNKPVIPSGAKPFISGITRPVL
jgi:hypothetical protein